jgi:hypothetical protein
VLTAVSSVKTRCAGSSRPCSRIQRRRARATSSRCRSAACRLFFKGDVMTLEEPPQGAPASANSPFAQFCEQFHEGGVRLFFNEPQYQCRVFVERGGAPSARLRRHTAGIAPALPPFNHGAHGNPEKFGRLVSRRSGRNRLDHALAQISGIGFRQAHHLYRRINAYRLAYPGIAVIPFRFKFTEKCCRRQIREGSCPSANRQAEGISSP